MRDNSLFCQRNIKLKLKCLRYEVIFNTPEQLRQMEKTKGQQIAKHNLLISFAEIRQIRQAIVQGNLWELVEQHCHSHPFLLEALRTLYNYSEDLEKYDPPYKKSAFFYSGPESLKRPEVYRHLKKLDGISQKKSVLLLPRTRKPYSEHLYGIPLPCYQIKGDEKLQNIPFDDLQVAIVDVPFGVIPLELDQVYPLAQNRVTC